MTRPGRCFSIGGKDDGAYAGYIFKMGDKTEHNEILFWAGDNINISKKEDGEFYVNAVDTTYDIYNGAGVGLVPSSGGMVGDSIFLNENGHWSSFITKQGLRIETDKTNKTTTISGEVATTASMGMVPQVEAGQTGYISFMCADNTVAQPTWTGLDLLEGLEGQWEYDGTKSVFSLTCTTATDTNLGVVCVDTAMSETSTHPVQNKVITKAFTSIGEQITIIKTTLNNKANIASPELTGTPKAPTAAAGTNTTQIATTAFVRNAVDTAISGTAAFKGVVNANTEISNLTKFGAGWYWVVGTAGTYVGQTCEVGDTIMCTTDATSYSVDNFNVLQVNLVAMTTEEIDAICTI